MSLERNFSYHNKLERGLHRGWGGFSTVLPPFEGINLLAAGQSNNFANWITFNAPTNAVNTTDHMAGYEAYNSTDGSDNDGQARYFYTATAQVVNTDTYAARFFLKKRGSAHSGDFPNVGLRFFTSALTPTGPGIVVTVDLFNGLLHERVNTATGTSSINECTWDSNWWEIRLDAVNPGGSYDFVNTVAMPAVCATLTGAYEGPPTGTITMANCEVYRNTVKAQIVGGPVYT